MTEFEKWLHNSMTEGDELIEFGCNALKYPEPEAKIRAIQEEAFIAGQKHPEWVTVAERPEFKHQKFVSVKLDNDIVQPALFHPEFENTVFTYEGHTIVGVIAWQPLPEV
jgi:hypothetical protein